MLLVSRTPTEHATVPGPGLMSHCTCTMFVSSSAGVGVLLFAIILPRPPVCRKAKSADGEACQRRTDFPVGQDHAEASLGNSRSALRTHMRQLPHSPSWGIQ